VPREKEKGLKLGVSKLTKERSGRSGGKLKKKKNADESPKRKQKARKLGVRVCSHEKARCGTQNARITMDPKGDINRQTSSEGENTENEKLLTEKSRRRK